MHRLVLSDGRDVDRDVIVVRVSYLGNAHKNQLVIRRPQHRRTRLGQVTARRIIDVLHCHDHLIGPAVFRVVTDHELEHEGRAARADQGRRKVGVA